MKNRDNNKRYVYKNCCYIVVVITVLMVISSVFGGCVNTPKYNLVYSYKMGEQHTTTVQMQVKQNVARQGEGSSETHNLEIVVKSKILEVAKDGTALLEETFQLKNNSAANKDFNPKDYFPFLGATFKFWVNPKGEAIRFVSAAGVTHFTDAEQQQFMLGRFILPQDPVAVSDRWEVRKAIPTNKGGNEEVITKGALKKIWQEQGQEFAEIDIEQQMPVSSETSEYGMLIKTTGNQKNTGSLIFNLTRGEETSYTGKVILLSAMEITHPDGKVVLVNAELNIDTRERRDSQ